jgi:hypothetical protein
MYWHMPAVRFAQEALSSERRFDVVLADDIDTVGLALSLRPLAGVHADIHEYAPRQNEELPMWRFFVAPYVRWMCRTHLCRADSVTTVGRGVAEEYRRRFGIEAAVVTNAAPYADLAPTPTGYPLRIVHSGAALRNRMIDRMMLAVAEAGRDVSLDLYLMPNDLQYLDELRTLASTSTRLTIHEPVPYDRLLKTLNAYDLGIHVIPPSNFNNRWSLPNKFFDYIQARLGLIIGPSPEMQSVLGEHHLGVATGGFEASDITRTLDQLDVRQVPRWKEAANASARELSAESQMVTWETAIQHLVSRTASR